MEEKVKNTILETLIHIHKVQRLLAVCISKLQERLIVHDRSKIFSDELDHFSNLLTDIREIEFGSAAYTEQLGVLDSALEHHYRENRHHPEHFVEGIEGMNLIDILEMTVDWMAAAERSKNGNVMRSLPYEKKRFNIDDQLYRVIKNTVVYLDGK